MHDIERRPRRDFLVGSAVTFSAVGLGFALYPMFAQMAPHPGSPRDTIDVDLATIAVGKEKRFAWKARPLLVRHRPPEEISAMQRARLADLRDQFARVDGQPPALPATDANRTMQADARWLVVIAVCTYRGCILKAQDDLTSRDAEDAWVCPCCASHYDASGRVRKGPAPHNLAVPAYRLMSRNRLEIG